MKAFYHFKQKNAKSLMTLFIFIIIPIVSGLALGYEMGYNKIQLIPIAVVDYDHSEFSRTLADYIEESEIFQVTDYPETNGKAEDLMTRGRVMAVIMIPERFSADMLLGKGPKIEVLYDATSMTVASSAKAAMSEILMTVKAGYMKNIYEGKLSSVESQAMNQIQPIDATYRTLFNPAKNYRNFLLPGMLAALMQAGFAIMGLTKSHERTLGFTQSAGCILRWGVLGAISLTLCLGIQYVFFGMPYRGSLTAGIVFTLLFAVAMTAFGYMVGQIVKDGVFATQVTCVLVIPTSILGGYTYPLMAMPAPLQAIGKIFPFSYYGDGIRRLCMEEIGWEYPMSDIAALTKIIIVEFLVLLSIITMKKQISLKTNDNETKAPREERGIMQGESIESQ